MEPDRSLQREDVMTLLASLPETVNDVVGGLDDSLLGYRHGPAFPTLEELLQHLGETSQRFDSALRHAYLDHAEEIDVRSALDGPFEAPSAGTTGELLQSYLRIRRRMVDLLRGLSDTEIETVVHDASAGDITLLDVCRLLAAHELGHLAQLRNLASLLPEPEDLGPVPQPPTGDSRPLT